MGTKMQIENFVELSSLINTSSLISAIALLVTMAGWFFTARKQEELLQKQIEDRKRFDFWSRSKTKIERIEDHIKLIGEICGLLRFKMTYSSKAKLNDDGSIYISPEGKLESETELFFIDQTQNEILKDIYKTDGYDKIVNTKFAELSLSSSEITDIANILDPSGELKAKINELVITILSLKKFFITNTKMEILRLTLNKLFN
jgi:hypothetical protein